MIRNYLSVAVLLTLAWPALGLEPIADPTAEDLANGERNYRIHCARCHGIDGGGGEGSNLARSSLKHAPDDESLLSVIGNGIPGTGMPAIWTLDSQQAAEVAAYVRTLGQIEQEAMPGDPIRGATTYESAGCSACHIIAGHGIGIGPELTTVGDQRGLAYLRQSLVAPAETQSQTRGYQDFLTIRLATEDRRFEGMRINEDEFTIQIRDISGQVHSFRKDELVEFDKLFGHSLMPGYSATLDREQSNDVISYLMSLRSEQ